MKSLHYVLCDTHIATLDVVSMRDVSPPAVVITRIVVPQVHRGHGVGSLLLRQACFDADKEGVCLVLEINPYGDGGLSLRELSMWYQRRGFVCQPEGHYIREPRRHECHNLKPLAATPEPTTPSRARSVETARIQPPIVPALDQHPTGGRSE
jgi:GNAT superfamily N-acetyltransferase